MKRALKYILILVVLNQITLAGAQQKKLRKIKADYEDFSYVKTSEVLLEVAEKGYKNKEILQKLGNAFYFNNNMEQAAKWYDELFKLNETVDSEIYFRYALALKSIGNYEASDKWMAKFNDIKPDDSRGKAFLSKIDYMETIESSGNDYLDIKNLNINTSFSEFGTAEVDGGIVFASSRGKGKKYGWNAQSYLDLYFTEKNEKGHYSEVTKLSSEINTKYHESSVAFTQDEKQMYFTRNNYFKNKYSEDDTGTNRLQLYRATRDGEGEWSNIRSVHFNSKGYSVAHPTVNLDGTRLYFASDMPGTRGESDIYVVNINEDGSLGTPKNLGPSINTEAQESFPFVNTNGDLYYSTKGFPGLGGYDVFVSRKLDIKIKSGTSHSYVVSNLGKPINSKADDFAYYENVITKKGFFSSNRSGGKGDDDIYSFSILECNQVVSGIVKDRNTHEDLLESVVLLYDDKGNELKRVVVDEKAAFRFELECGKEYLVRGKKTGYIPDEKRFTIPKIKQTLELVLFLDKEKQEIQPCDDLAKVLDIPVINFDFDKYNIRYDASVQLQKVLAVLNKYPTMAIDIRSHTDCRGSMAYNAILSENRAQATRQYLIDKGVKPERLTAKGYGESHLLNQCGCEPTNDSNCSEAEHQLNRRSEFIIKSIKGKACDDKNQN